VSGVESSQAAARMPLQVMHRFATRACSTCVHGAGPELGMPLNFIIWLSGIAMRVYLLDWRCSFIWSGPEMMVCISGAADGVYLWGC
jgi:hypothetical protein